ncbi:MAG TPA: hypothetical protein PKH79_00650 [Prolixibacteraceae bacterium]|nr:hypothetical protein [Prolixibacteraceae bacterium]HPS14119.1 hypothetical protein [Prolixibacteraceae bacterium]
MKGKSFIDTISNFKVHLNLPDTVVKAVVIAEQYGFSFYDSLIIAAALEERCDILFSEDMHDGLVIDQSLSIINPFKYE